MKTQVLSIDQLRIDGDTQSRLAISENVVEDYAELITASKESKSEWPFPPLDVFHDGTDYFVADGFHRVLAAERAKRASIPCTIRRGTAKDARIFGMTANDRHGLRMTRADKRACVEWLIENGGKMKQLDIAKHAGVSLSTVRNVFADRNPASASKEKADRKKGKLPFSESSSDKGKPGGARSSSKETPVADGPASSATAVDSEDPFDAKEDVSPAVETPPAKSGNGKAGKPHDPDEVFKTERSRAVKTVEALIRCFDDLHELKHNPKHDSVVATCKSLLAVAKGW